jgi:hypothetical protein
MLQSFCELLLGIPCPHPSMKLKKCQYIMRSSIGVSTGAEFEFGSHAKGNGKSTRDAHRNWFASCEVKSFAAGSGEAGSNHPGASPNTDASTRRALPWGVACAEAKMLSAKPRLLIGSMRLTTCNGLPKAKSVLKANPHPAPDSRYRHRPKALRTWEAQRQSGSEISG